jgi:hypothetical protein
MLKPLKDLLAPDQRHMPGSPQDAQIGVRLEDLHADMLPLELHGSVPDEVRWQFDTARHAFIYSWFCYDLVTLAEQHSYGALENGLRLRAQAANILPKGNGLKRLLTCACHNGWLDESEFVVPGMPNRLEMLRVARNHVSHGQPQLFLPFSLEMMRLCAEILNKLFPEAANAGRVSGASEYRA